MKCKEPAVNTVIDFGQLIHLSLMKLIFRHKSLENDILFITERKFLENVYEKYDVSRYNRSVN
jgi:hypothetical protein